jgi:hypothetical protein
MFKKIFIAVLFIGLFAALVLGGINRTLAKSENEPVNYERANRVEDHEVSEPQGRGQGRGNSQTDVENFERKEPADTPSEDAETHEGNPYNGQGRSEERGQGGRGFGGGSKEPLSDAEIEALNMALDDEYHALSTYQAVMASFGEVEPFASIAQSEQRHIDALANQFNKYGIPVPENPYSDDPMTFESLEQACQIAAQAEIDNAELYTQLFEMTDNQTFIRVFTNLSRASSESHLPEFQSCQ